MICFIAILANCASKSYFWKSVNIKKYMDDNVVAWL